jgi:cytoplasmic iron level regulating protein YaaA (DUF328/UPF0246 family)
VLILLPPSEGKAAPARRGRPLDLAELSFPGLTDARDRLLTALAKASAAPDALTRLGLGPALAAEVQANVRLRELPARPAIEIYTGVLYAALDWTSLPAGAKRRAASRLVIASALWGALRPADRIPPYRLPVGADLPGVDRIEPTWRAALPAALEPVAQRVIVDCRSQTYVAMWKPRGELAEHAAAVRVWREGPEGRTVVGHLAKHTRGLIARDLLQRSADPRTVPALAEMLSERWDVETVAPKRAGRPWFLDVLTR